MSSLLSLQLLGVRSFGPDDEDVGVVKFLSPITLILGQNGCGKTTLIESLKFATCGELPDNTNRGSGYLYDPHLADSIETRGFVKLKFKDINGDTLLVHRPMQVTQKPKNLEFKRLDSAIKLTKPNGESTSLSSRCSDIDNLVTSSLGVSKAILTNVIFCHQEDSSWPLDEGKKVKERFDAIFDSKKYNSCLENIRKLRKNNMTELRIMKAELQNLLERKNEAGNKRAALSETESRMSASRDRVKTLKEKLVPISVKLREIAEKEDNIGKIQAEFESNKTRLNSIKEIIGDLKTRIQVEFQGSNDELEAAINNFQEEVSKKEEKLCKFDSEMEKVITEMKSNQKNISEEQGKMAQLALEFNRYKDKLENRNKIICDLCADLGIKDITSSQLSESNVVLEKTVSLIERAINEKQDDIKDMKSEHDAIVNQLQAEVDSIREEKAKKESSICHKKQQMASSLKECNQLKQNIEDVDKSAESLSQLDLKLENVTKELNDLNSNNDLTKIENDLKENKSDRDKLEADLSILEKEVQTMQKLSSLKAEIDVQKETKISKEEDIKKIRRRHKDSLIQLLGEIPEQGLKIKFQSCSAKINEEIRTKREEIKVTEREATKLETEKKHLLDKLRTARQNLTSDECLIDQECGNKSYDSCLSELSTKVQEYQDQKGTLSSSEYMFRRYVQKLEEQDPCCPLCHRDFQNEEDVHTLIEELTLKMRELPSKLRSCKQNLDESQDKYKKLLQLKPKYDKLSNLKSVEIPTLQTELDKTEVKLEKAQQRLKELQKELSESMNNEELAKSMQEDVIKLEQYCNDVKRLERDIQKLESKLPPGSERCSLDEALSEQELLRSRVNSSRKKVDALQSKLNFISMKKQKIQEEKSLIQAEQMKISGNAQMRSQLIEKLKENESLLKSLQVEIDEESAEIIDLTEKLENSSRLMKSQISSNMKMLQDDDNKLKRFEQKFGDIGQIQSFIKEFETSGGVDRIESLEKNILALKKLANKLEDTRQSIYSERDQLKSDLATNKTRERDLEDNMKMRAKLIEEGELSEKINSLKRAMRSLDYVSITVKKNKLRQEEENINREKAQAEGRQRELESSMSSIKAELNKDIYKNADKNYKDKLVQIKVEEVTIDDLNKYFVALDWALTHFHQEKMKAINATIRDLWRQIYQGNDIDSIEIKTDVDLSASADKRRTYNYRVIQKKNGIEMEMRGRCSAGQKVLACLIIRMALAETFSSNCGVLALDEPTTNLDHANITSLSEALVQIVNQRSNQKNFQLIIISHDKAFLEVLQRIDKSEYYYNISRNHKGRSRIEKVTLYGGNN